MRLWHIDLIPYLPKSQLLAQWRELNSIFKKQDNHILINYIYDYDKLYLKNYANKVMIELSYIGVKFSQNSINNYNDYFKELEGDKTKHPNDRLWFPANNEKYVYKEHNNEYLTICYYNLKEKYLRGQKDFTQEIWNRLDNFYKEKKLWN